MISVERLTYLYPPALPGDEWTTALAGLSFSVPAGGSVAVVGPNNAGKSTLCLAVAGLAPRLTAGQVRGSVQVAGRDVQAAPPGALADVIGLVLQDPVGQLFTPTVEDEIAWGLENLGVPPGEMHRRITWALEAVGLADVRRDHAPQTLSGGQQKRLALAAALALQPRVLLLDEPSGGLAPAGRRELVTVLRGLREREGVTLLFAESDPEVVAALADEVLLLERGTITASGTPRALFASLSAAGSGVVALPPASRFGAALGAAGAPAWLTAAEAAGALGAPPPALCGPPAALAQSAHPGGEPALRVEDLHSHYQPGQPVLRGVTFSLWPGEIAALVGDNGAGKTTLARHLIGLLRPDTGRVLLSGEDTRTRPVGQVAQVVGFAFQNPEVQIFSPTVREEVAFGPRNLGLSGAALDAAVEAALDAFGLADCAGHPPASLSFSTRRMVALASIAAMQTPVLVLDEPTVGLDAAGTARVMAWLAVRRAAGAAVLLITHDMELAAQHADRMLVLHEGRIALEDAPAGVFARPELLDQAGLRPPFAVRLASALNCPALGAALTPEGAAHAWRKAAP